jgi:hypothetical protein
LIERFRSNEPANTFRVSCVEKGWHIGFEFARRKSATKAKEQAQKINFRNSDPFSVYAKWKGFVPF